MHIADFVRRQRTARPQQIALICSEGSWTWSHVVDRSTALASTLASAGLRPGDRVAVLGTACHRYWETQFACAIGGYVAVPINHRLIDEELRYVCSDAGCRAIVTAGAFGAVGETIAHDLGMATSLSWGDDDDASRSSFEVAVERGDPSWPGGPHDDEAINVLGYTSGTTGRPKASAITHRSAMLAAFAYAAAWGLRDGERLLCPNAPYVYRAGGGFLSGLVNGAVVTLPFEARTIVRAITDHTVNAVSLAPAMLAPVLDVLEETQADVSSVHSVIISGAPASADLYRRTIALFGDVVLTQYGMTEATGIAFGRLPAGSPDLDRLLRSVGRPSPLLDVRIERPDGTPCDTGEAGEIVVRGDTVMQGYWRDGAVDEESLRPGGWFATGDIGQLDADGLLRLTDRRADIINSGGLNVYSLEVENVIAAVPGVTECCVVGTPDARWGEVVTAVVVADGREMRWPTGSQPRAEPTWPGTSVPAGSTSWPTCPATPWGRSRSGASAMRGPDI